MCYNISLKRYNKDLEEYYRRVSGEDADFKPVYSVSGFAHPNWPVIKAEEPAKIGNAKWGLVPAWTRSALDADKFRKNNLNARSETVFDLPSFRSAIKSRRCLIPVSGFFEWMELNKNKYPHYIFLKERPVFSLAGIYESWVNKESGEELCSFSILTTDANPLMARIHNNKKRMPLILAQEQEDAWLNLQATPEALKQLMQPYPQEAMDAYTISKRITSRKENPNAPETLEAFDYPELALL